MSILGELFPGGAAHVQTLRASGASSRDLERMVRAGTIERIRRSWYCLPNDPSDTVAALRVCSPSDRNRSLVSWAGHPQVVTHWQALFANPTEPREMLDTAAACAAACLPRDHAIVAFDSLVNRKVLSHERLRAALTPSHEWMLALVVELDSRTHHDNPEAYERDRARDLWLVERGYLVVRVTYKRVLYDWASVERALLAIIRRGEHLWQPVHRRAGLASALE